MKLEKAGEIVSDAAKIHPNQGSGSMYDKLDMTIHTTPDIRHHFRQSFWII
jgi:hypothetical protein